MKAAVIHQFGDTPRYEDFPDPVPAKGETLLRVKAVVLENVNKMMAKGTHYASHQFIPAFPAIIGHGGIGLSEDGKMLAFGKVRPPFGAFAEQAAAGYAREVPGDIDAAVAAALPSAALTSLLPLMHTAALKKGDSVLINGATGVSGKLAIQIARLLGAGRITGTGRNRNTLESLSGMGADAVINLKQPDDVLLKNFQQEAGDQGYDIVLDYLWGPPSEVLLKSLIPKELGFAKKAVRFIHIGEKAGSSVKLSGEMLRTSGLELSGVGNISPEALDAGLAQIWDWVSAGALTIDIETVRLRDIEKAWQREDLAGKRLVVLP